MRTSEGERWWKVGGGVGVRSGLLAGAGQGWVEEAGGEHEGGQ